jgi:hypothetical protein
MKKVMSQVLLVLLWAVWTGLYWGFVASFGWLVGAVAGKWIGAQQGMWTGGVIGLGVMITVVLGTSKLRVPLFAGCCGGMATGLSAAILLGASADLWVVAGVVGFFIGSLSAIPKPYTSFDHVLSLVFLGALSGTAIALVAFFTADTLGWIIAHTIGLAIIGFMDGLYSPIESSSRRIGLLAHLVLEWASKGAVAGVLVATVTESVIQGSDAAQAKLVGPVCVSLLVFVSGAVSYELRIRQRQRLQQSSDGG